MSWAAHNPEAYDAVCRTGIMRKLDACLPGEIDGDILETIVETLFEDSHLAGALCGWASKEINKTEEEYWGNQVDAARNTRKDGV